MGLAGPRKRTKIAHDPNNTAWSRNTTSFGHKILSSQGWTPGTYLGAKDASHAAHYTAANASHIRVLLKDDTLGLGAKNGNQNAETFGLSAFSGLLGRLNGKDVAVLKKEEDSRRDVELRLYQGRKYGSMNFVSAGLLEGSKSDLKSDWGHIRRDGNIKDEDIKKEESESEGGLERVAEKRKRDDDDAQEEVKAESKKVKVEDEDKAARRAAKAARKIERAQRREKKAARRAAKGVKAEASDSSADEKTGATTSSSTATSAPASGASTPMSMGRHAVRQRYIQQKRMANLDPKAMREIFMIKT